jgi:hypothetical protein
MRRQDGAVGGSRVEIKRGMREEEEEREKNRKTADKDKGPPENVRPTD